MIGSNGLHIYNHIYFGENEIKLVSTLGDELIAARSNWERLLSILFQDDHPRVEFEGDFSLTKGAYIMQYICICELGLYKVKEEEWGKKLRKKKWGEMEKDLVFCLLKNHLGHCNSVEGFLAYMFCFGLMTCI